MQSLVSYSRISGALLKKNLIVLRKNLASRLLDGFLVSATMFLIYSKLFPLLGMPTSMIPPLYLGAIAIFIFFLNFSYAMRTMFDLEYNRLIDYHIILPLPKSWLIATQTVYSIIETSLVTIPLFAMGLAGIEGFSLSPASLLSFAAIFLLANTFYALFFLGVSYWYSFHWFLQNVWPRRLTIMLNFGASFLLWKQVHAISAPIAYIMLCNPLTYIAEGTRASLIGGSSFISLPVSLVAIIISIGFALLIVSFGIKKRLDPV